MKLLEIKDLSIHYVTKEGTFKSVNHVNLELEEGETIGLVGETGAGKTTTALGILRLLQSPPAKIVSGEILFKGTDLLKVSEEEMQKIRGNDIAMIFQDPMTALKPIMRVGDKITEVIELHNDCTHEEARKRMRNMLELVGINVERAREFPHQFSGGMKQRVVIAMALACNPHLLIADEPTTALDVTIQAQVLEMMNELKEKLGTSMILITHDLGIVASNCDKVAIMYAGEIVECGSLEQIFHHISHPYTEGLFNSIPSLDKDVDRLKPIKGLMPDPSALPEGCKFNPRCQYCTEKCRTTEPPLYEIQPGHLVRCLRYGEEGQ